MLLIWICAASTYEIDVASRFSSISIRGLILNILYFNHFLERVQLLIGFNVYWLNEFVID